MLVRVRCLGMRVDGMGRPVGLGSSWQRKMSGGSEDSGGSEGSGGSGKGSSSGSDTVRAGEDGRILKKEVKEKEEKEEKEAKQGEQGEPGEEDERGKSEEERKDKEKEKEKGKEEEEEEENRDKGKGKENDEEKDTDKGKGKEKESDDDTGEDNSNTPTRNERVFFRPVLIDGFPLGYVPLVYRQQESLEILIRDQAGPWLRYLTYNPRERESQELFRGAGLVGAEGRGGGVTVPEGKEQHEGGQAVQEWLESETMGVHAWQARMGNPEW